MRKAPSNGRGRSLLASGSPSGRDSACPQGSLTTIEAVDEQLERDAQGDAHAHHDPHRGLLEEQVFAVRLNEVLGPEGQSGHAEQRHELPDPQAVLTRQVLVLADVEAAEQGRDTDDDHDGHVPGEQLGTDCN